MNLNYRELLNRFLGILDRVRSMQELNSVATFVFLALLAFGIINCVLGYRLLRFWVMLFGFAAGAVLGYLAGKSFLGIQDQKMLLAIMMGAGLLVALFAFLIYDIGILLLGAGIGVLLSTYILMPKSSAMFFLCLVIGAAVGVLALKFSREVLIVGTSFVGGALAGLSLAKLLGYSLFPYGLLMSLGFAVVGTIVQFLLNPLEEEEDEDEEESEEPKESQKTPKTSEKTKKEANDFSEEIDPLEYPEDAIDEDGYVRTDHGLVYYEDLEDDELLKEPEKSKNS